MKALWPVLLVLLQLTPLPVYADFFQWTDDKGVVHLTDDRNKIPKKYKNRVKEPHIPKTPAPVPAPARAPMPAPATAPASAAEPQPAPRLQEELARPGGHDESWWRGRFAGLREQIKAIEEALPQKQAKLVELRRERRIYTRSRDREAVNAMDAEIAADEVRINQLRQELEELELEAAKAAVPVEWRR